MTAQTLPVMQPVAQPDLSVQESVMGMLKTMIEHEITNQPRSLQKRIGPSEIGMDCDHCLAARLAGWDKHEPVPAWLPFIGTAVHATLERLFTQANDEIVAKGDKPLCLVEQRVTVGQIGSQTITGSTDLFLPDQLGATSTGMTVDWKIVGNRTLDKVRSAEHPGKQYEVQAHLYARGWENAGYDVSHVAVYFMPRQKPTLNEGYWWIAEYNPDIADKALARANHFQRQIDALATISSDQVGKWISGLDRAAGCYDCAKYPDYHMDANGQTSLGSVLNIK
ncbi:hypothetical protein [Trueperella bialowiezensis]|uniref:Uncharacterized protein n=1 Tax=Trueperella bialowiezensis TaxID=312285 RepID=A0A3S4V6R3_9ACTO|nr:hypothetical protein [Trueperella bialowiezensis]VEI13238.1 Uncharacterised protein [Trueperella bialowiezensis]